MTTSLVPSDAHARPGSVILRACEGEVAELMLVFQAGFAVGPFSVGQQGDWQVRANGVADLHLYLWFDGLTLYAAKLHGRPDASVGGEPLSENWQPLADGAELRVGDAKITVSAPTVAERESVPPDSVPPDSLPPDSLLPEAEAQTGSKADGLPEDGRPVGPFERLGLTRNSRPTLRAILLLCGLPILLLLWFAVTRSGKGDPRPARSQVQASPVSSPAAPLSSIGPEFAPPPRSSADPLPRQRAAFAIERVRERPYAAVSGRPTPAALERRAVDAVLERNFRLAAEIYERLSVVAPESKVFSVARRIAARKAATESPM